MPTKLLSLYLRVGARAARLALRLTERVVMAAGSAIGITGSDGAATRSEPRVEPTVVEATVVEPAERGPRGPVVERVTISQTPEELIARLEHNPFAWHCDVSEERLRSAAEETRRWLRAQAEERPTSPSAWVASSGFNTFIRA